LRLLPSGPDRVGEALARANLSSGNLRIGGPAFKGAKRPRPRAAMRGCAGSARAGLPALPAPPRPAPPPVRAGRATRRHGRAREHLVEP